MVQFEIASIGKDFEECRKSFEDILDKNKDELGDIRKRLEKELEEFNNRGFTTLAFIGEYSAGKSTIISALTNRKDIKISSDIATDETTEYEWNGIHLIDTPGLYTERKNHDEITYQAINRSDLLVYCLTYSLFDSLTAEDFKDLAFTKNFRNKMMLSVNKMSSEKGNINDKKRAYTYSMAEALKPFKLQEFPISFVDALDYIDGNEENNNKLIESSGFLEFIKHLNEFYQKKSDIAQKDTPIRILIEHLNEAVLKICRNDAKDTAYLELLSRIQKAIENERKNLRSKVSNISLGVVSKIVDEGLILAQYVGEKEKKFKEHCSEAQKKMEVLTEEASKQMEIVVNETIESIQNRVKEILNSPLAQSYIASISTPESFNAKSADLNESVGQLKEKFNTFKRIADGVGLKIVEGSANEKTKLSGQTGGSFLKATQVAGSSLHKGIYSVGKFVGWKFKPWQAVRWAKNLSNIMKVAGPILTVVAIGLDAAEAKQEAENEIKMSNARLDINDEFISIAGDLEQQFKKQLQIAETKLFNDIENNINEAKNKELSTISTANNDIKQIKENLERLDNIIKNIVAFMNANEPILQTT